MSFSREPARRSRKISAIVLITLSLDSGGIVRPILALLCIAVLAGCADTRAMPETGVATTQPAPRVARELRLTGILEAIHTSKVTVPQIVGQGGRLTLTRLISNGVRVKTGDVIAEFDPAQQLETAFTARAKYEDLSH